MTNSKSNVNPSLCSVEPDPDFPLSENRVAQWCQKISDKIHYFGLLSAPDAALAKYLRDRDELQAGPTVKEFVNRFLDV